VKGKAVRVLLVAFLILATTGCSRNGAAPAASRSRGGNEAVPVTVATVVERSMPVELQVVGTVEPCASVSVRAQVGGELTAVHFAEGQEVQKNDLLFTIDPRLFEAQLHQAEANLAKDTAQADNAAAQARRYRDLIDKGIATREQLDQISTTAAALQATVKADTAAVETARLQLQYATIRAPIGGRTGSLIVQPGNIVRTSDTTPLVLINQLSPIYVTFSVPESALSELRRYQAAGTLRVEARVPDARDAPERGIISFVDNAVDRATGTIRVKGTFPNAQRRLWPGLFVNVVLTLRTEPRALVVPARAVQDAQDGKYVYVVKADGTVESRPITIARTRGDEAVVASGLAARETVVIDGQLRLVAGKRVTVGGGAAADPRAGVR
jgi:membrane fusion protein, multidrug efflux system